MSNTWQGVKIAAIQNAIDASGNKVLVNCEGFSTGSFSYHPGAAVVGSFVGTIKQANSPNGTFTALSGVATLTSAVYSTGTFSCSGYSWLMLDITAAGTSGLIEVNFTGIK